jgi:hypothetical protein
MCLNAVRVIGRFRYEKVIPSHTNKKLENPTQQSSQDSKNECKHAEYLKYCYEKGGIKRSLVLEAACDEYSPDQAQGLIWAGVVRKSTLAVLKEPRSDEQGDADG